MKQKSKKNQTMISFSDLSQGAGLIPSFDWVDSSDIKCINLDKRGLNQFLPVHLRCRYCGNPIEKRLILISYREELFEVCCEKCILDRLSEVFCEQIDESVFKDNPEINTSQSD